MYVGEIANAIELAPTRGCLDEIGRWQLLSSLDF